MTRRDIPNALSAARIVLIVPLVMAILHGEFRIAFALFAIAGLTDGLDGFLARRFDWRTPLGGILDPAADKLMTVSVFIALAFAGLVPMWLALLMVARDGVIVGGVLVYRVWVGRFRAAASPISKINTLSMLLYVVSVLSSAAFGWPGAPVTIALGGILTATAIASGLDYVRMGSAMARRGGDLEKS